MSLTVTKYHVDLSDGTKKDDCKDGDGQPEGERVGHIPAKSCGVYRHNRSGEGA